MHRIGSFALFLALLPPCAAPAADLREADVAALIADGLCPAGAPRPARHVVFDDVCGRHDAVCAGVAGAECSQRHARCWNEVRRLQAVVDRYNRHVKQNCPGIAAAGPPDAIVGARILFVHPGAAPPAAAAVPGLRAAPQGAGTRPLGPAAPAPPPGGAPADADDPAALARAVEARRTALDRGMTPAEQACARTADRAVETCYLNSEERCVCVRTGSGAAGAMPGARP